MRKCVCFLLLFFLLQPCLQAQAFKDQTEGDYTISNFSFEDGSTILSQLTLHYITIGKPIKNKNGKVTNAILIMHGTCSSGRAFLGKQFGDVLFREGQILDANKYFIILPDAIGHGKSSKPSDSLHMRFPNYTYNDMVLAQYRLLTEHLGINHLRLVMGTSMGAMHTWVWGYSHPQFMDALLPLACLPVALAGRNWMMRQMAIDLIESDSAWHGGEYTTEPKLGLRGADSSLFFMNSSPYHLQQKAPNREAAVKLLDELEKGYQNMDANDLIYQLQSSRNYNPSPYLNKIRAPLFAINSADDEINPPDLGIMENEIKKVPHGRYILLPFSIKTEGHGTNSLPVVWENYLQELLKKTEP